MKVEVINRLATVAAVIENQTESIRFDLQHFSDLGRPMSQDRNNRVIIDNLNH